MTKKGNIDRYMVYKADVVRKNARIKEQIVFAKRLNELLIRDQITYAEVEKKTGILPSAMSSYLNAKYIPKMDVLIKLADAFNVSIDYLVGRIEAETLEGEEIYCQTGLSEKSIKKLLDEHSYFNKIPDYRISKVDGHSKEVYELIYKDENGDVKRVSEDSVWKDFADNNNRQKLSKCVFDTLNKIIEQEDSKLLQEIASYLYGSTVNTDQSQTLTITNNTLISNMSYAVTPYDYTDQIDSDLIEFMLLKIQQTLKSMRQGMEEERKGAYLKQLELSSQMEVIF